MTIDNAMTNSRTTVARRFMPWIAWGSVVLAVVGLVVTGEASRMLRALGHADWWLVAPLLVIGLALPVVHARRWQIMLRVLGHDLTLDAAVDLTISSTMINYTAPGYLWSPAKGLLARQMYGIGLGRSVPTLAVEQVLDAVALLLGTMVGLTLAGPTITHSILVHVRTPSTAVVVVALVLIAVILGAGISLLRRLGPRFSSTVVEAGRLLARDRSLRVPVVAYTAARWVLDTLAIWLAAKAVGVSLGAAALIMMSNLPLLVGLISPMPGGVGFREGAMAGVAGVLALPVSAILAAAILHRTILLLALPIVLAALRIRRWAVA